MSAGFDQEVGLENMGLKIETPPRGRRRAGDAISGGAEVEIINRHSVLVNENGGRRQFPGGAI